jgi:threonine synthase
VQVIAVDGGSDDAKAYVNQLLDEKKIKASNAVAQKYYSLALVIDYRS